MRRVRRVGRLLRRTWRQRDDLVRYRRGIWIVQSFAALVATGMVLLGLAPGVVAGVFGVMLVWDVAWAAAGHWY